MVDHHSPVFASTAVGGVVRTDRPAAAVVDLLTAAGWRVAVLPAVADLPAFHRRIAAVLDFPAHYGANLDALWDCLSELEGPTALVWQGWADLAIGEPQQWARLLGVLRARAEEGAEESAGEGTVHVPAFAVVLEAA